VSGTQRLIRVTLESGDADVIDASEVTRIQNTEGRTWVECGRMVYVVRESALSLKLQMQRAGRVASSHTVTIPRVYSA